MCVAKLCVRRRIGIERASCFEGAKLRRKRIPITILLIAIRSYRPSNSKNYLVIVGWFYHPPPDPTIKYIDSLYLFASDSERGGYCVHFLSRVCGIGALNKFGHVLTYRDFTETSFVFIGV